MPLARILRFFIAGYKFWECSDKMRSPDIIFFSGIVKVFEILRRNAAFAKIENYDRETLV